MFVSVPSIFAEEPAPTSYTLLAPIPLGTDNAPTPTATTATFLPGLFRLIIAIATGLAVIMLIYAGVKYISTDAFGGKEEAKGIIEDALWGLLLAMSAWLILNTINPNLVNFDLRIERLPTPINTNPPGVSGPAPTPGVCVNCQIVSVPHKPAPNGCAAPGPCKVDSVLNSRLSTLNTALSNRPAPQRSLGLEVTESYPPTRAHVAACHNDGTCVDANFSDRSAASNAANIKDFITAAGASNLRAVYEVTSEARATQIRNQGGLSASQVIVVPGITREHFSVYKN